MDGIRTNNFSDVWKPDASGVITSSIQLGPGSDASLPPIPAIQQFLLYREDDADKISDSLGLSSMSNLRQIATWHSKFSTSALHIHADLQHGESHFNMCKNVISSGSFESICPWAGVTISTVHSVVVESRPYAVPLYAYRFETKHVFYVMLLGSVNCSIVGVFFPELQIFVSFDGNNDVRAVEKYAWPLRDFLIRNANDLSAYLGRTEVRCAVLVSSYHFAHHLWNELSAIHDLIMKFTEKLDVWVIKSPIGPLDRLYAELKTDKIHDCNGMKFEAAAVSAMRAGVLWAPLGRTFIPADLPRRILSVARELYPMDQDFCTEIRKRAAFVLWVTVRTDARVCLNQASLIAEAITISFQKFGSLAVIFDGHTPGYHGHMNAETQEAEDKIVDAVCRLATVPFIGISLIGANLLQAIIWGQISDFYIANHGTIQHKIGWLHDKPGICHYFRKPGFAPRNFGAIHARENGILPIYMLGDPVERDGKESDPRHDLFSYQIDLERFCPFYEGAISMLNVRAHSLPATSRSVLRLREDPHKLELSRQYLAKGDSCWNKQDISGAIDNFAKAWSLAPKDPGAMNRMVEFSLMNLVSWRRDRAHADMRMLALRLILLMDQGNKWARNQLCNELLSIEDEADLATACFELNSLFPHFAEHFVRYVEDKALGVSAKTLAAINGRVQLQRAVHAIA